MSRFKLHKKKVRYVESIVLAMLFVVALITTGCTFQNQEKEPKAMSEGGVILTMEAKNANSNNVSSGDLEKSRQVLEDRAKGIFDSYSIAYTRNNGQIVVYIPLCFESEDQLSFIGEPWMLEFARLDSFTDDVMRNKIESGQFYNSISGKGTVQEDDSLEKVVVPEGTYTPLINGSNIVEVEVPPTIQYFDVNLTLDEKGTEVFAKASKELAKTQGKIVILLDGVVQTAPAVNTEIRTGSVSISGGYSGKEARLLSTMLKSGPLDTEFEITDYELVKPSRSSQV